MKLFPHHSLSQLRQEIKLQEDGIKQYSAAIAECKTDIVALKKRIREFPKPMTSVPQSVKKHSSVKRYALFNQMLKQNGHSTVYRDRLKTGGLSVKARLSQKEKKIARLLADQVSTGVASRWNGYGMERAKFERYIFQNIPGTSKYATKKKAA
jgi:septal ring factor EnvC (AmiA/AmiB activator)